MELRLTDPRLFAEMRKRYRDCTTASAEADLLLRQETEGALHRPEGDRHS